MNLGETGEPGARVQTAPSRPLLDAAASFARDGLIDDYVAAPPLDQSVLLCGSCAEIVRPVVSRRRSALPGVILLRGECPRCREFIAWLPRIKRWLDLAPPQPTPAEFGARAGVIDTRKRGDA